MPYANISSPRSRFSQHKKNAARRRIPFSLTFEQWWSIWNPHWSERGKGAGRKVMARYQDQGAYEIGNVFITTQEQNSSEKHAVRPHSKLRENEIPCIRAMLAAGIAKHKIGTCFGVSRNAIRQIAEGKTWRKYG